MDSTVTATLLLGFVFGVKHALEPDHLVAVSTMVSEHRSIARSSLVGTLWGLGHTASLLAIGMVILLLRVSIPARLATIMEMSVAVMLVVLGASVVTRAARERGVQVHAHTHTHDGGAPHTHIHVHSKESHNHRHYLLRAGRKPFVVGMVHGVAGSAALTLLVLSTIPSAALGLAYIAVFGAGSIGGMLLMSAMISLPFVATAQRFSAINAGVRLVAGLFSIFLGLALAWELIDALRHAGA